MDIWTSKVARLGGKPSSLEQADGLARLTITLNSRTKRQFTPELTWKLYQGLRLAAGSLFDLNLILTKAIASIAVPVILRWNPFRQLRKLQSLAQISKKLSIVIWRQVMLIFLFGRSTSSMQRLPRQLRVPHSHTRRFRLSITLVDRWLSTAAECDADAICLFNNQTSFRTCTGSDSIPRPHSNPTMEPWPGKSRYRCGLSSTYHRARNYVFESRTGVAHHCKTFDCLVARHLYLWERIWNLL